MCIFIFKYNTLFGDFWRRSYKNFKKTSISDYRTITHLYICVTHYKQ